MSSDASMRSRRRSPKTADWIVSLFPLALCVALAIIASMLLGMLAPIFGAMSPAFIRPSDASPQQVQQFGAAALLWTSVGSVVFVCLLATFAVSLWTVYSLSSHRMVWLVLLCVVAMLAGLLASFPSFSGAWHEYVSECGWITLSIDRLTDVWNGLTAATVAALFVAAGALIFGVRTGAIADVHVAARRLKWLLTTGAVSLVLGVVTIGWLYRLPATLVKPLSPTEQSILSQAIRDAVAKAQPASNPADIAQAPVLDAHEIDVLRHWVTSRLDDDTPTAVVDGVTGVVAERIASEGDRAGISQPLVSLYLPDASQSTGAEVVEAIEHLALHTASFWGVVFTAALALFYVPTAATIVSQERRGSSADPSQPMGLFSLDDRKDDQQDVFKSVLRVLIALSPLLGGLSANSSGRCSPSWRVLWARYCGEQVRIAQELCAVAAGVRG